MLGVKSNVWELSSSTTLVGEVETKLLLFRSEDLFEISFGVWSEKHISGIAKIRSFDFVVVSGVKLGHYDSTASDILVCHYAIDQNVFQFLSVVLRMAIFDLPDQVL